MPHRIEVTLKFHLQDPQGLKTARQCREDLKLEVSGIRTIKVYLIDTDLSEKQLKAVAEGPFSDPVIQVAAINRPLALELAKKRDFSWDWLIECGFRPGVTDNEGRTAREALELVLGRELGPDQGVYTSTQYCIKGKLTSDQVKKLAKGLLANDLIQRTIIVSRDMLSEVWSEKQSPFHAVPRVREKASVEVKEIDLLMLTDEELTAMSKDRVLALSLKEMKHIREYVH